MSADIVERLRHAAEMRDLAVRKVNRDALSSAPSILMREAADRIEELEAALRQIAEECPVSITHVWMNTAEVPPVFQQMYDDLAGGDSDE